MSIQIKVSGLFVYPVKSLAGISLDSSRVDAMGLHYDRRWMLVSPDGLFLSQRKVPRMALINTALDDQGQLTLSMKGKKDHTVPLVDNNSKTKRVRIWNDELDVPVVSKDSDAWLSSALGVECQLVYIPDNVVRQCDPDYAKEGDRTGFSDGFPMLLISEESLNDLNSHLKQKGETAVEMRRFRPNIVVTGCEPYAEDNWQVFKIADLQMRGVKPCSRCILTTVDPDKGERSGTEPLATLKEYRQEGNKVLFGMNVIPQTLGEIKVGDLLKLAD